jgi:biotin transport system substrate-specific component
MSELSKQDTDIAHGIAEDTTHSAGAVRSAASHNPLATDVALVSTFSALIAASTLWPGWELVSGVPITLQTFAVLLSGAVLGARRGALAVLLYLAVGAAGAPVFAERKAGIGVLFGATGGYLVSFVLAAFVAGWLVERVRERGMTLTTTTIVGACAVASFVVVYPIGASWLKLRLGLSAADTLKFGVLPFLFGDILKCFAAAVVAAGVHRAFPALLPKRK